MFLLKIEKKRIDILEKELLVSGSQKVYTVSFEFGEIWKDFAKMAVFKCCDVEKEVAIAENTPCEIPWEVLVTLGNSLYVGVYGTRDGNVVMPTVWCNAGLVQAGVTQAEQGREPTPDIFNQMLELERQAVVIAQSVRDDADNGVFKGDKGDRGEQGEPFEYEDFTEQQLADLKGAKGDKGDKGDPGGIGYIYFTEKNGHLIANVPEQNTALTFEINTDGHLGVTYE